ncbi:MAG: tyrosine-type recombinase/integrase [Methylobacter sp.]|uniref:tyrosine-type recombinase/integrase n=1 Tax=Methylobacter sp. TaxID=2051955 RepID=UPI0025DE3A6E|nr:tyrosine-type recombinase/integrase [Methylobacter sp.]MCK9619152.1 tyrosine-type recombinase/integrase [Methylobacter sp.]
MEENRQATVYGVRPKRTFREAATKYLLEAQKASLKDAALHLKILDAYIGDLALESVHMGTLQPFIQTRRQEGVKNRTINYGLQTVRHILNLAAMEWIDEYGLTWLASPPKIKLLQQLDARKPFPLSWEQQDRLFNELPDHLLRMALFKVNTGCREQEVCSLRWDWEEYIPELEASIFVIPALKVKNRLPRVVVLNSIARTVIEQSRGQHPEYVFTYKGHAVQTMNNSAWQKARKRIELPVRIHDLKHTFGRRLRAANVSFEDRQDLLGHKSSRITDHYSSAEVGNLIAAAEKVCVNELLKATK